MFDPLRAVQEIVPIEVVGLSRPGFRRNMPSTPPFCMRPPSRLRAVLICGTRRGLSSCAPSATLDGNSTCARASLCFLLLALLDDFVLAIGGGNTGRAGIGVGSTYSSSSKSAESEEIGREKLTGAVLHEIVQPVIVGASLGVKGPTGSSSVPPPLWPFSDAARNEPITDHCAVTHIDKVNGVLILLFTGCPALITHARAR